MGHYDENRKFDEEYRSGMYPQHREVLSATPYSKRYGRHTINVEWYSESTLNQWTDGSKFIINTTMSPFILPPLADNKAQYVSASEINEISRTIDNNPNATFFIIASMRVFLALVELHRYKDLRLLLL